MVQPSENSATGPDHKENPKTFWQTTTADPVAAYTLCLVIIAAAQAAFFVIQLRFMRRSMDDATTAANAAKDGALAATEANKLNRDHFATDQRPWLSVSNKLEFTSPVKFEEGGAFTTVKFSVRNSGKSPALNVGIDAVFVLQKMGENFEVDEDIQSEPNKKDGILRKRGRLSKRQ
jgi:hypothetical protein